MLIRRRGGRQPLAAEESLSPGGFLFDERLLTCVLYLFSFSLFLFGRDSFCYLELDEEKCSLSLEKMFKN